MLFCLGDLEPFLARNQRARRRRTPGFWQALHNQFYVAYAAHFDRATATLQHGDRIALAGWDVRDEHTAAEAELQRLDRFAMPVRGERIEYAELDGVPICITEAGWRVRDFGHEGPHIYEEVGHRD